MAGITKEKHEAIQASAMQLVTDYGIKKIDAADAFTRPIIAKGFAAQLMQEHGITLQAARNHIAKACRRQRHPDWNPEPGWGGVREGAGKKTGL